ncbi:hypothetical protein [Streptomyces sp. B8F3]|uniref:hypothetical protein n=1 Tax=unclassified Streptomyces TaxID=2593676 RepID=UPI00325D23F8
MRSASAAAAGSPALARLLADDTEAARLLEEVLRTAPLASARRGALTVRLGRTAIEARRYADVLDLFEQALAEEQPRAVRGQLRFFTVLLHEQAGSGCLLGCGLGGVHPGVVLAGLAKVVGDQPERHGGAGAYGGGASARRHQPGTGGGHSRRTDRRAGRQREFGAS